MKKMSKKIVLFTLLATLLFGVGVFATSQLAQFNGSPLDTEKGIVESYIAKVSTYINKTKSTIDSLRSDKSTLEQEKRVLTDEVNNANTAVSTHAGQVEEAVSTATTTLEASYKQLYGETLPSTDTGSSNDGNVQTK